VARLRAREGVGRRREVVVMTPRVPPIRRGPWTRGARRGAPVLTVKIRQPSHEFTFGVGITFVSYSLVLTPVV
jgi:hypothetical protein